MTYAEMLTALAEIQKSGRPTDDRHSSSLMIGGLAIYVGHDHGYILTDKGRRALDNHEIVDTYAQDRGRQ